MLRLLMLSLFFIPFTAVQQPTIKQRGEIPKFITNPLGMELVMIPAGTFMMGSPAEEIAAFGASDEGPIHRVEISKSFYLGKHEVTRGQFRKFVEATRYKTDAENDGKGAFAMKASGLWEQLPEYTWRNCGYPQTDDHPVVSVSWNDAQAFTKWLSEKEKRTYRLPTEAEWEYAARAGTSTRYITGVNRMSLSGYANVADNSTRKTFFSWIVFPFDDGYVYSSPVGKYRPNAWGLYDMTGNVWEWCLDSYASDSYQKSARIDPVCLQETGSHVARGASWSGNPAGSRVASRMKVDTAASSFLRGFRVVLVNR